MSAARALGSAVACTNWSITRDEAANSLAAALAISTFMVSCASISIHAVSSGTRQMITYTSSASLVSGVISPKHQSTHAHTTIAGTYRTQLWRRWSTPSTATGCTW